MANRLLLSKMWTRGREILARGDVEIDYEHADKIAATVYGTEAYTVELAREEQDDYCSCPYFPDHGYCKHIAAVILYYKAQGQTIDDVLLAATVAPDADAQLLPNDVPGASAGSRFVDNLGLSPVRYFHGLAPDTEHRPELELNLEIKEFAGDFGLVEMEFVAWLRVADASTHNFYLVRDITAFLDDYRTESRYYTSGKASFELSAAAFSPAERALLEILDNSDTVGIHEMTDDDSRYQRYVRLDFASFNRLVPLLPKLTQVVFRPVQDGSEYAAVHVAPFRPDAGLITATVTTDAAGYHLWVQNHVTNAVAGGRVLVNEDTCYLATIDEFDAYDRLLMRPNALTSAIVAGQALDFAPSEGQPLQQLLTYLQQICLVDVPTALQQVAMTPHFDLDRAGASITLALSYDYGGTMVADGGVDAPDVPRNFNQEVQAADYLASLGFTRGSSDWQQDFPDADALYHFFTRELPNLRANGTVTVAPALANMVQDGAALQTNVQVATGDGLLSVAFSFAGIDADEVDAMLKQLEGNQPYVQKADGTLYVVDDELKRVAAALTQIRRDGKLTHGQVHVPAARAFAVQSLLGDNAQFDAQFKQLAQDLAHPEQFPYAVKPVHAQLRPYQQAGVQWLEMLNSHGFGGILADEMGLGKTLQMLTFLNDHVDHEHVSLVVAPASLLYNWQAECAKFAPDIRVAVVDGTKEARREIIYDYDYDLLITSYNMALRDINEYYAREIQYLVLDEAQMVKNGSAKTNQSLRKLEPRATFALSGTPIENRAEELWSIFALVLPGLLPKKTVFKKMSAAEIALRVKPFILRREKKGVLQDLPPMVETNIENEMTKEQKTVYLAQLQQMRVQVQGISDAGLVKNKIAILAGLTRLRQVCDTPALFMDDYTGDSGKLEQLAELVQQAEDSGRHVLIFSQFTHMLTQIERRLHAMGLDSYMLRGSTKPKDRLAMVDAFNRGEKSFFLISLKAGGTGLNLTGADMVILVDLWWNPAVEDQAIARAHRIGQQNEVDVYRMITKGTIEEQIVKLQDKKRDFVNQVLIGTQDKGMLSNEDIREILGV